MTDRLSQLFKQHTGDVPGTIIPIPGSGSNRRYFRLIGNNTTLIGVEGTSFEENKAFIALSKHLKEQGLNVPQVVAISEDYMYYLQNDLGDISLFDSIENGRKTGKFSERDKKLLKQTISCLPDLQFKGAEKLDFSVCFPQETFDKYTIFWDLNYFKYYFLKISGIEFLENLLENDFEKFAGILLQCPTNTFMFRDFQSRNVMLYKDNPFFIDFQGGRKGPVYYDVASFLWQAKANFPDELRQELLDVYLQNLKRYSPGISEADFKSRLRYFVLFRTLQVLGAYGFRGYIEKKKHFIESIPFALNNLKDLLQADFSEIPYLRGLLNQLLALNPLKDTSVSEETEKNRSLLCNNSPLWEKTLGVGQLEVVIYSFSYKKGIPKDKSGNGGGYVFDCRAIHNPGRYEEYKNLTGLDQPVIDFLEKDGEIKIFLNDVYHLADTHIRRYIERGFTNLMFCFGCTGGQHRSVYSAQHLYEYVCNKYNVKVKVIHREQSPIPAPKNTTYFLILKKYIMCKKKMFSNAVIALSLIVSSCYFSSCHKITDIDKFIEEEAKIVNKICPVVIDGGTRLDSVTHPAKSTLGYYYTLINLEKDSLTFGPEMFENRYTESIKSAPQLATMRELDVIFKYVYFDKNGDVAFEINITPEKYK